MTLPDKAPMAPKNTRDQQRYPQEASSELNWMAPTNIIPSSSLPSGSCRFADCCSRKLVN